MARVNPPLQLKTPDAFFKDPQIRMFIEQQKQILFQLWTRTGGSVDGIESNIQAITTTKSRVSKNAAILNSLELKLFEIVQVTDDFTTERNQIIICKNDDTIEITLDPEAIEEDEVHIKRRGKTVNVIGIVDGKINPKINIKLFSVHYVFDGEDWSQI